MFLRLHCERARNPGRRGRQKECQQNNSKKHFKSLRIKGFGQLTVSPEKINYSIYRAYRKMGK
jgi:hypothetical protein